jgi:hypothetical protein
MKRISFLFFALAILLTSCTVYKEYPIDVYKPGDINVPSNAENVALVYRNFKYKNDTLQHYYKDNYQLKKAKVDPVNLDSILANYCLHEMASKLKEHNSFDRINIFPDAFKPHTGEKLPVLDFGTVKKITSTSNTDLLISLESFSYFYSQYEPEGNEPEPREVITAAAWGVYDPVSEKILERKTMIDTIYWNAYDENGNYQKNNKLPPRLVALKIASQLAGENYSKRFYANWQSVLRMYSVPPLPDFEAAEKYLRNNDWDNAILLWKRYADDKNGKMAINARYNLALAYEMKDDIETAWKWLASAKQIATEYRSRDNIKMITKYQNVLAKRMEQINRLNKE